LHPVHDQNPKNHRIYEEQPTNGWRPRKHSFEEPNSNLNTLGEEQHIVASYLCFLAGIWQVEG